MRFVFPPLVLFGLITLLSARSRHDYTLLIKQAQHHATPAARTVLTAAHRMVASGHIVRGSCWDYLNAAFTQAGYLASKRTVVFRHSKNGPYAHSGQIRPGDWLYYINRSYGGIEHSGLFVDWINRAHGQGLILSYKGERCNEPGHYRPHDLCSVYQITRAQ
jgi:hypothetical protein